MTQKLRNIAIIAHVDHGKTTLIDKILQQAGALQRGEEQVERLMDSNDIEKERGITILAKNTALDWHGHHINIVDTPGHADFGGEVERILSMVDSVLLIVDAVDGPMPQTRFVTSKAFANGLNPILMVNKIDREGARPDWVVDEVFELFDQLGANDEQLDFPVVYGSAIEGRAGLSMDAIEDDMSCLMQTILDHVPAPQVEPDAPLQMQISALDYNSYVGVIGVDENIVRGDCSTVAGNELVTALELAELAGKSTGIISTARITHATPAATYAKSADRNWEDVSDMPAAAVTSGCKDIAEQLVNFKANLETRFEGSNVDGLEVVFGGGRRHFLPRDAAFNSADAASTVEGDRTDGRDLTAEWSLTYPSGAYVFDQAGFNAIDTETTTHVFGLFNESHMQYEADRGNDIAGEPSIAEMTAKAIEILDNNPLGFFLSVESGRIDHSHHAGSAYGALTDTIAFSEAIALADEMTNDEDTLIIVTADHGHVFTIAGYPKRGNPILGKVVSVGQTEAALAADGQPYTTLGYTNGRGFQNLGTEVTNADASYVMPITAGRQDLSNIDTTSAGFHQEALVPLESETHSGEDVGIYAKGPGAFLLNGTNEQNMIYHVMDFASDLSGKANSAQ
jgi:small GTP-binding protein